MIRFFDILFSGLAIIILLPVMLPIVICLMLTGEHDVFYLQERIGKDGKPFKVFKFATMMRNSSSMPGGLLTLKDDPRILPMGKFLRKTSLDELPQLFNILFGQMSLVGPRPVTEPELVKYGEYRDYVLSVTPGLTGMWQVSGRSDTGYEERITYDTYYIQNWSIWLDIWILIKTVWVVLVGKGAY